MNKVIICSWILIDEFKRVLLIKRKFNKKDLPNYWSFPWWKQEIWENNIETVAREVKEEVWLDFEITRLFIEEEWWNINNYFYRFLWNYSWEIKIQDEECDWYWWFFYQETEQLLIYQKIKDLLQKLYEENLIK